MDALTDFSTFEFEHGRSIREVYRQGTGPAVLVMPEVPGITPEVARFARHVAGAGFTVFMPNLFGRPGQDFSVAASVAVLARLCISREFRLLSENRSSPVTDWLRALAKRAYDEIGGRGVGAIGMCVTGNFALTLALDPWVMAPVLLQPSLPLPLTDRRAAAVHATPEAMAHARQRVADEGLAFLGVRFQGDRLCQPPRFDTLRRELGPAGFESIEVPDSAMNPKAPQPPHSVLTTGLIDRAGEPTRQALDRVLGFLVERLRTPA